MYREKPDIERLLAAYHGTKLDRLPHFDYIDPLNVGFILRREPSACPRSDGLPPADAVTVARYACMDYILGPCHYWPWIPGGDRVCTAADLDRVNEPITADYRRGMVARLEAVKGTGLGVGLAVSGPFFTSYMQMGPIPIQSFLLNVLDDREFVERLMDLQVERQIRIVQAVADLPVAFVDVADDVCDNFGYMIAPRLMEELWVPRMERLLEALRGLHVPITAHVCGRLDPVLPRLVGWGIRAIHPVQPNCNDIYALKKEWGDRICPIGNINIQGVLAFGTPAQVEADVREHIEQLGRDGGYVCASSHSIVDAIPPQNYRALVDAVVRWG